MRIDHNGFQIAVAKQLLNQSEVQDARQSRLFLHGKERREYILFVLPSQPPQVYQTPFPKHTDKKTAMH